MTDYAFWQQQGICPQCKHTKLYGNEKICPECLARLYAHNRAYRKRS